MAEALKAEALLPRPTAGYTPAMWRKRIKLVAMLLVMVPAWAMLGALATFNSLANEWTELAVGASVGVFFGLAFGGDHRWKIWDHLFGTEQTDERE